MDPNTAWALIIFGVVLLIVGIGGKIVIRFPGLSFAGLLGAFVVVVGVLGLASIF